MKIYIDINHPAHVHYFRNFITIMEEDGHEFVVSNRDSEMINYLLDFYKIPHITRNKRPDKNSFFSSLFNLLSMTFQVYKNSKNQHIDLFLGFGSSACAMVSAIRRKPCIILDDTEHNHSNHAIYKRFCDAIITPHFFAKNLGEKHFRMNAFTEQMYLHGSFFKNSIENNNKPYILCRFSAYDARHDANLTNKLTQKQQFSLVENIAKDHTVYVSHEKPNEEDKTFYKNYFPVLKPENMHYFIANANLVISEGATMASEAGVLGVNYYYINPLDVGNINDQVSKYKNAHIASADEIVKLSKNLPIEENNKVNIAKELEQNTINPTRFLIWFVQNYPKSMTICKSKQVIDSAFMHTFVS